METNIIIPLPPKNNRIKGHKYLYKNEIRYWTGRNLNCQHNKEKKGAKYVTVGHYVFIIEEKHNVKIVRVEVFVYITK